MNTFEGEEALQREESRSNWNLIIEKRSGGKDQCLRQPSVVQYFSTNKLLMHHVLSNAGQQMYTIPRAERDVWIGLVVALCDVATHGSPLLWFPATAGTFFF